MDASGGADHYAGRQLVTVAPGQVVAKVLRMVEGTDGRDVTGRVLKPRAPKPCPMKLDRGLTADGEGRVIVDFAGVIEVENGKARVVEHMHVAGDVDFNTGHVAFTGALSIAGGVKPSFTVKATGDVQIGGLVEDATVTCGGSLDCRRGMTAKTHGEMNVTVDAHAVFLNCIHGVVGGKLAVQREMMNCVLEVRGELASPRAVVLGGKITLLGCGEVNELGSDKWRETDLVLGWSVRTGMNKRIAEIQGELTVKKGLVEQIKALGKRATAAQRESLTEMEFQMWELDQELRQRRIDLDCHMQLAQQPMEHSAHYLIVNKTIHPKVRIHLGTDVLNVTAEVHGPVRICLNDKDHLVGVVAGCGPRPLAELVRGVGARRAA